MKVDYLNNPVFIHVCKDRTLSYRTEGEPVFNGAALPVFSVMTEEEAINLITLVGSVQYESHPLIPGKTWKKINFMNKQYLELSDLDAVSEKLADAYNWMKK
jgi:hypothetical protein